MKTLILITLLITSFNSFSAEIVCGSTKATNKRTYPINAAAIKLAASLGLKACTGTSSKRFVKAMKAQKHTGKFVVVSAAELSKAQASLTKAGGSTGPSFN